MKTIQRLPIRHGDLALIPIARITEGLKPSKQKVLLRGSNNNPHSIDQGTFYPVIRGEFVVGELLAKSTTLTHHDHGEKGRGKLRTAKITDGAYEVLRQIEQTHSGMRKVED